MSKQLEKTVIELIEQQELKRTIEKAEYRINKQFDELYSEALGMVKEGEKMPKRSKYYAQRVKEQRGFVNNAYIVQKLERNIPHLKGTIERYRRQCREELVERLSYGKR